MCMWMKFMFALQNPTEQVGSNGNIAHFWSRDTWSETKLGHQLSKLVLWISLVAAGKCQGRTLNYIIASSFNIISNSSHVMAQIVSCQPLTMGAQVHSYTSPFRICCRKSGTGTGFSPIITVLAGQYHSTNAPHLYIHLPLTLYILAIESIVK